MKGLTLKIKMKTYETGKNYIFVDEPQEGKLTNHRPNWLLLGHPSDWLSNHLLEITGASGPQPIYLRINATICRQIFPAFLTIIIYGCQNTHYQASSNRFNSLV